VYYTESDTWRVGPVRRFPSFSAFGALAFAVLRMVDAYEWLVHTSDVRVALSRTLSAAEELPGACPRTTAGVEAFARLTTDSTSQQARLPTFRALRDRACAGDAASRRELVRDLEDADAAEIQLLGVRRARLRRDALAAFAVFVANLAAAFGLALSAVRARRRAVTELRESEERFRLLAESATDLTRVHAPDGSYLYATPSCERLLGYTPAEMLAMPVGELFHPDEREELLAAIAAVARNAAPPVTHRLRRKTGEYRWFETQTHPIFDARGKLDRYYTTSRDVHDRVEAQQKLERLTVTDELTSLHNRRGFVMLAGHEHLLALRQGRGLLLVYADLDGLKRINDELGHDRGDEAIRDFAQVMRKTFRASDVVARLGGDEFAALAFDVADHQSGVVEARMRSAVDAFNERGERPYRLSASVGCALLPPGAHRTLDDLVAEADKKMYERKRARPDRAAR